MSRILPIALAAVALTACAPHRVGPEAAVPVTGTWRSIATHDDRERLREWRTAWLRALEQARGGGHAAEVEGEGALLDPDAAVAGAAIPAGDYRCRVIKVGAKTEAMLPYVAYPGFSCRVSPGQGGVLDFTKLTGSQRPIGRLFPENRRRMIFLGTLQLGDEQGTLRYGHDRDRDMAGILERIGEGRWRLVFPSPAFESMLDVVELIPAS
ncbi:MAG TPA: DUF4893 domain-containing protein [Allosphingosinicella sp.]|jgi:hypothetical protein